MPEPAVLHPAVCGGGRRWPRRTPSCTAFTGGGAPGGGLAFPQTGAGLAVLDQEEGEGGEDLTPRGELVKTEMLP